MLSLIAYGVTMDSKALPTENLRWLLADLPPDKQVEALAALTDYVRAAARMYNRLLTDPEALAKFQSLAKSEEYDRIQRQLEERLRPK